MEVAEHVCACTHTHTHTYTQARRDIQARLYRIPAAAGASENQ